MFTLEARHIFQTVVWILPLLHALEVHERIVLHGVELHEGLHFPRNCPWDIRIVCEKPIAIVYFVRPRDRKAFLVALPALSPPDQLIGDCLASSVRGRNRQCTVNVDIAWRSGSLV